MKPTRQLIIDYLERKGAATSVEMARALHLTSANIRHHLSVLLTEGAVEVTGKRRESQRGRSTGLYSLRSLTTRHNLDTLAAALLSEALSSLPESERGSFLGKIAVRMHSSAGKPASGSQRFVQAVNALNDLNYDARWEARADAPRVILGHCPYAAVLAEHPELCRMDAYLLEEMLGEQVVQTAKLEQTPQGLRQCVFRLGAKKKAST